MSRIPPKRISVPKKPQAYHAVPSRAKRSIPPIPIARQIPSSLSQNPLPSSSSMFLLSELRFFGLERARASPRGDEILSQVSRGGARAGSCSLSQNPLPSSSSMFLLSELRVFGL